VGETLRATCRESTPALFNLGRCWIPLALIPVAVLFLQLPISLIVWNLLPKLRFLQFPWRWLVVLEAPMAIFAASAVWPRNVGVQSGQRRSRIAVVSVCSALFLACTVFTGKVFFQVCDDEDAVRPMFAAYGSGAGFTGTDEYAPPGADNTMVATGLPFACLVTDPSAILATIPQGEQTDTGNPAWDPAQGTCRAVFGQSSINQQNERRLTNPEHLKLLVIGPHAGFLILRLRSYPAWQVTLNGSPVSDMPTRDDGLMVIPVPERPVDLSADWSTTPDVLAGRLLSALSVLLLTAVWLMERRRARPHL